MMPIDITQIVSFDTYFRFQHLLASKVNVGEAPANAREGKDSSSLQPGLPTSSLLDLVLRVVWLMFGPMLLCVTILMILTQQHAWFSLSDVFSNHTLHPHWFPLAWVYAK